MNPAKNKITMSAQSLQNFASALKWYHKYENTSMNKIPYSMSVEVKAKLKALTDSYKGDISSKKARGVMKAGEGKDPLSAMGYKNLCSIMYDMRPEGNCCMCNIY